MLGSKKGRESPPPMPRNYDEGTRKRGSVSSQNSPYKGESSGGLLGNNDWPTSLSSSLSKQATRETMKVWRRVLDFVLYINSLMFRRHPNLQFAPKQPRFLVRCWVLVGVANVR